MRFKEVKTMRADKKVTFTHNSRIPYNTLKEKGVLNQPFTDFVRNAYYEKLSKLNLKVLQGSDQQ